LGDVEESVSDVYGGAAKKGWSEECSYEHYLSAVSEIDVKALQLEVARSKAARLRAGSVLEAGQELR